MSNNLVFRIIKTCNQNCEYCFLRDLQNEERNLTLEEISQEILRNDPVDKIYITGGEPTSSSYFYDVVNLLVSFGLSGKTTVQTNGTSSYFKSRPDVYLFTKLNYFISVPSLHPECFYKCTRNKDSQALSKLEDNLFFLSTNGAKVIVNIVIDYNENFKQLDFTLDKLLKLPIFYFNFSSVILPNSSKLKIVNWSEINFKKIYNKITSAGKFAKFDNFPPCILPREALVNTMSPVLSFEKKPGLTETKVYNCGGERIKIPAVCSSCSHSHCLGFPIKYFLDYGETDILNVVERASNE